MNDIDPSKPFVPTKPAKEKTPRPRRVGRPTIPESERKSATLTIRVTPKVLRGLRTNALGDKLSLADYVFRILAEDDARKRYARRRAAADRAPKAK